MSNTYEKEHPFRHREVNDSHWQYIDWFYFLDVEFVKKVLTLKIKSIY